MVQEIPELHNNILEAIATLTGRSLGDVYYAIEEGKFNSLALEALHAFVKNYHIMDRKCGSEPVDDKEILKRCIEDLERELETTTDPTEISTIKQDIVNIQQRLDVGD